MLRLIIIVLFLFVLPFIIIFSIILIGITFLLIKFNFIKSPIIFKTNGHNHSKQDHKSFTQKIFYQLSCKHHNLDQENNILICSDCGKIIKHS